MFGRGEGPEVRMHLGHLRRRTLHYVPSLVPLATPEITVSCVHTKTWYNPSSLLEPARCRRRLPCPAAEVLTLDFSKMSAL